jgi:hypothetical protein
MSLKAPTLWIEQRGLQHRVYWRNSVAGLPARSYLPFYERDAATKFINLASLLGMDVARRVLATDDPQVAMALLRPASHECDCRRAQRPHRPGRHHRPPRRHL